MDGDEGFVRYFAYLNYFVFSMLLLVLAANFVVLIVGWAFVGAASYLLISFWYRRTTATQAGIKAFVINVIGDVGLVIGTFLLFEATGELDFEGVFGAADNVFTTNDGQLVAACLMLLVGRLRQVGPAAAAHLAARRHGGPHAGLLPDPRGHDGHRGRLPDRAHVPAVRAGAAGRRHQRGDRHGHAAVRGHRGAGGDRPQAGDRLLHDLADRLHDPRGLGGGLRRRAVPPHDPRLLQGPALHGGRLGDRRDGRQPVAGPHGRLSQGHAVHVRDLHHRRPGPVGLPADVRLLLQGRGAVATRCTAAAASW